MLTSLLPTRCGLFTEPRVAHRLQSPRTPRCLRRARRRAPPPHRPARAARAARSAAPAARRAACAARGSATPATKSMPPIRCASTRDVGRWEGGGDYEQGWKGGFRRGSGVREAGVEAVTAVAAVAVWLWRGGRRAGGLWCHRRDVGWEEARACLDAKQGLVRARQGPVGAPQGHVGSIRS